MTTTILQRAPESPDLSSHYLFYLHGLIVEEAGIRPRSEEHGYYEYEKILGELAGRGFVVISEARPQGTQIRPYAEKIAAQVRDLLAHGVAPANITVAGASKGGIITAYISTLLQHREIHFVFLAGLFEKCLQDPELKLYGHVLSIHDRAEKQAMTPSRYFQRSQGLGEFKEIVVGLDLGHGLIYQPYREWVEPLVEWTGMK